MTNIASNDRQISTGDTTRNDRFAGLLAIVISLAAIGLGIVILERSKSETWIYENREAGIDGRYPAQWLVNEQGDYIVQIRDPRATPFKTQYILRALPLSQDDTIRNVLDNLTLQRSTSLSGYRVLDIEERNQGNRQITEMSFVFVDTDPNPYIERLPIIVLGLDRVIQDGDRAIVVTFMSAKESFNANLPDFEQFMATLEF